jgi:hypothetical protein
MHALNHILASHGRNRQSIQYSEQASFTSQIVAWKLTRTIRYLCRISQSTLYTEGRVFSQWGTPVSTHREC